MTMHCTLDELLALRANEAGPGVRTHIEECEACQEELDRLGRRIAALRTLPVRRPPRDRWPVVRAQFEAERRRERRSRFGWGGLAVAAGLALAAGLQTAGFADRDDRVPQAEVQLQQLVDQSRDLEQALAVYGTEGRVLSARTAGVIAELEDRIALVDAGIARMSYAGVPREQLVELWRDRVQLMGALVNTHVTRATYVGF